MGVIGGFEAKISGYLPICWREVPESREDAF
jgi:hypothetical protein